MTDRDTAPTRPPAAASKALEPKNVAEQRPDGTGPSVDFAVIPGIYTYPADRRSVPPKARTRPHRVCTACNLGGSLVREWLTLLKFRPAAVRAACAALP